MSTGPAAVVRALLRRVPVLRDRAVGWQARRDHAQALRQAPEVTPARPEVLVAGVLSLRTARALAPEWQQRLLEPHSWRRHLDEDVQLLLVESSAPRLVQDWSNELTRRCRELGITSVLWVDEPVPVREAVLAAAPGYDHVFWTDPWAGAQLGEDRLGGSASGLLAPALQPLLDHPAGRPHGSGTAVLGHSGLTGRQRRRLARELPLAVRPQAWDVGQPDTPARWPDLLLDVTGASEATEGHPVPVLQLCARQLPVVSNRAGVRELLGQPREIPEPEQSEHPLLTEARALAAQPELRDRAGLAAWRAVLGAHTVGDRVDQLLEHTGLRSSDAASATPVSVLAATMRPDRLGDVFAAVGRQTHRELQLVLVPHGYDPDPDLLRRLAEEHDVAHLSVVPAGVELTLGGCLQLGVSAADGEQVAKIDDDDHYGAHYLADLLLAARGAAAEVVGKGAHYVHLTSSGATVRRFPELEHRYTRFVQGGTLLTTRDTLREVPFADLPRGVDSAFLAGVRRAGGRIYSADRFNFVSYRGPDAAGHTWPVGDHDLLGRAGRLETFGDPVEHCTA